MPKPPCAQGECLRHEDRRGLTMTPLEQLTGLEEHAEPEPTPTTLMGLQSRPSATSRSSSTTPMDFKSAVPAAELA